jgi:hypothetical protein
MKGCKSEPAHEIEQNVTCEIDTARMGSGTSEQGLTFEQESRVLCERLRSLDPKLFRFALAVLGSVTGSSDENDVDMDEIHFIR